MTLSGRHSRESYLDGVRVWLLQKNTCTVKLYIPLGAGHTSSYTAIREGAALSPNPVVDVFVLEYATAVATVIPGNDRMHAVQLLPSGS